MAAFLDEALMPSAVRGEDEVRDKKCYTAAERILQTLCTSEVCFSGVFGKCFSLRRVRDPGKTVTLRAHGHRRLSRFE